MFLYNRNKQRPTYDPIAIYYDLFYSKADDIAFYLAEAQKAGGNVLELCCGTGRILIQLAKGGLEVTGIDISREMLEVAQKKIDRLEFSISDRIQLINCDIRKFSTEKSYNLIIIAYSSFLELKNEKDRKNCLVCCRNCLAPKGIQVMDNLFHGEGKYKDWGPDHRDGRIRFKGIYPSPIQKDEVIQHLESTLFDPNKMTVEKTVFADHIDNSYLVHRRTFKISWHYISPEQIKDELKATGFKNVEIYGNFNREPIYDKELRGKGRQIIVANS